MAVNSARIFQNEAIDEIAKIISRITGNQFSEKHNSMIEFRLKKRCVELKIDAIENYYQYFKAHQSTEVNHLISLLTTHHTFFFREFSQFQFLEDRALPEIIPIVRQRSERKIRIWSAACSKGHEVYSLAMFLDQTLKQMAPDITYQILGSDIDTESLAFAYNGVYTRREIKEVPLAYLGNHWARGTGDISDYVKARSTLRENIHWMQLNLLTLPENFTAKFDLIFCRNVFIYFNQAQVKQSSLELLKHLEPHGYYFIGLSESLNGMNLPLVTQGPSIYRPISIVDTDKSQIRPSYTSSPNPQRIETPNLTSLNSSSQPRTQSKPAQVQVPPVVTSVPLTKDTLRVLCVDDSPSIITLLKKILAKEEGFEVVGTASNGLEATIKLKEVKPDIMTLDIHMPNQTGVEYLQKNYGPGHPPVVMVSSVSREESDLALKALHLGASDYVEKPALSNLREASEEIKRKLRSAYRNQVVYKQKASLQLDDAFKKAAHIKNPQNYLRIILAQLSDKQRIQALVKELGRGQPPTFILLDGAKDTLQGFADGLNFTNKAMGSWPVQALKVDDIFVADAKQFNSFLTPQIREMPTSFLVMGEVSPSLKPLLEKWSKVQILLEDLGPKHNGQSPFKDVKTDIVPVTSFAYMSFEFFGRQK